MKSKLKPQFIVLRADGNTYAECCRALNISRDTARRWDGELTDEISNAKAEALRLLYKENGLTHKARVQALGEMARKLDAEINKRDLSDLTTDRLLTLRLRLFEQMQGEYREICDTVLPMETGTPEPPRQMFDIDFSL